MDDERRNIPVIALRDSVLFPGEVRSIMVGRDETKKAIQAASEQDETIFVCAQIDPMVGDVKGSNLYRAGTLAKIERIFRLPETYLKITVRGLYRWKVLRFNHRGEYMRASIQSYPYMEDENDNLVEAYRRKIIDKLRQLATLVDGLSEDMVSVVSVVRPDVMDLVNLAIRHMDISIEEQQSLLNSVSITMLSFKVMEYLSREIEILTASVEIERNVEKRINERRKQALVNEKIDALRSEISDEGGDPFREEITSYRKTMKKKNIQGEAKSALIREIDRLEKMHPASAEAAVSRTYIEWLLELPWGIATSDQTDIPTAKKILDKDHYDLRDVKDRIIEHIALVKHTGRIRGPILCLVGPPGVGKTSLGRSIARAMGRKFVRMSLGGIDDESEIRGHRRTYVGAQPGRIIQSIKKAGSVNPVFLLDEIDKLGKSFQGDPASALLEVLDPEQNNTFTDNYLEVEFDLSNVLFITTANTIYGIPEPLMDRMEMLRIPGYTDYQKLQIAKQFLIPKSAKFHGIKPNELVMKDRSVKTIIDDYTQEAGVRELERQIQKIMRLYIRSVEEGKKTPRLIPPAKIRKLLGKPVRHHIQIPETLQPGVALGLAWTPAGGEILLVETVLSPGQGKLILTGSLGDVLAESAQAALSFVRSRFEKMGIADSFFQEHDIHIHIPEGAVPKDGPSAGITLASAIASLFSGIPLSPEVAMTGEVTLSGRILPVGGLPEKLLAAKRYKRRGVIVPLANENDIDRIDKKIKDGLTITMAATVDDVFDNLFPESGGRGGTV